MLGQRGDALTARLRHDFRDVGQERGLVAAFFRARPERAWRQKGGVGFDEKPTRGDLPDDREKVLTAALVTDPAGDSNEQTTLEVRVKLRSFAREAMHDTLDRAGGIEDRAETLVSLPLVEKERHVTVLS